MDIRDPRSLSAAADDALRVGRQPRQVILYYTGLITLIAVVMSALDYVIGSKLSDATGLGNRDLNVYLSTAQSILPLAQLLLQQCLSLGYLYAMIRVGRKLYADGGDLKVGFRRLGPILRCLLLQFLLYMGVGFVLVYPVSILFAFLPMSDSLMQLLEPLMSADPEAFMNMTANELLENEALMEGMMDAVMPMIILFAVIYLIAMVPIAFRLRMSGYLLADTPGAGAIAALLGSFRMTRRNCLNLLKVDLHLWWYHGLILLLNVLAWGDVLCGVLGITLPFSGTVGFYLFQGVYLAGLFAVYYFFRNKVELTYIMAYEALKPREEKKNEIVLGNIFQM